MSSDDDETSFWWMFLDHGNVADALANLSVSLDDSTAVALVAGGRYGPLVGIVSEADGGIIAYAIGEEHAMQIVTALAQAEGMVKRDV